MRVAEGRRRRARRRRRRSAARNGRRPQRLPERVGGGRCVSGAEPRLPLRRSAADGSVFEVRRNCARWNYAVAWLAAHTPSLAIQVLRAPGLPYANLLEMWSAKMESWRSRSAPNLRAPSAFPTTKAHRPATLCRWLSLGHDFGGGLRVEYVRMEDVSDDESRRALAVRVDTTPPDPPQVLRRQRRGGREGGGRRRVAREAPQPRGLETTGARRPSSPPPRRRRRRRRAHPSPIVERCCAAGAARARRGRWRWGIRRS